MLTRFRGIATLTALGLIAEIGDFARFSHPRELASWLGITPSAYSSGEQQHRGHITKDRQSPRPPAADRGRLALPPPAPAPEDRPRLPKTGPGPDQRACRQLRLYHRHRHLSGQGKPSTVVNIAVAREPSAFLWAAMTDQPQPPGGAA